MWSEIPGFDKNEFFDPPNENNCCFTNTCTCSGGGLGNIGVNYGWYAPMGIKWRKLNPKSDFMFDSV